MEGMKWNGSLCIVCKCVSRSTSHLAGVLLRTQGSVDPVSSVKQQYRRPSNQPVPNKHVFNRHCTSIFNFNVQHITTFHYPRPCLSLCFLVFPIHPVYHVLGLSFCVFLSCRLPDPTHLSSISSSPLQYTHRQIVVSAKVVAALRLTLLCDIYLLYSVADCRVSFALLRG